MRLIDRLSKYLIAKAISPYEFERTCGIANGYLGKQLKGKGSVGSDILEKVSREYPDLNLVWLITGKGKMIVSPGSDEENSDWQVADEEAVYAARDQLIRVLKEQLQALSSPPPRKKRKGAKD